MYNNPITTSNRNGIIASGKDYVDSLQFVELVAEEFQAFAMQHSQQNFMQTLQAKKFRELRGESCILLGLKSENGEVVCGALCHTPKSRVKTAVIFYGPLINYGDLPVLYAFTNSFKRWCKNNGYARAKIIPYVIYQIRDNDGQPIENISSNGYLDNLKYLGYKHTGFTITGSAAHDRWHYVKRMDFDTIEDMYSSFDRKARRHIRKGDKLTVCEADASEIEIVHNLVKKSGEYQGFVAKGKAYLEHLLQAFGSQVKMIVAFTNENGHEIPVSTGVFMITPNEVTYFYAGNDRNYRKLQGSYAIQKYALKYCIENKIEKYNFFGFDAVFTPENGVLNFKQQFNGHIEELLGVFELPVKKITCKLIAIINSIRDIMRKG